MKIKRVYHPYWEWEEVRYNMWGKPGDRKQALAESIQLTSNHSMYGSWMLRALTTMPNSCEHNLSDVGQNRKAWIGHAACALALNCPEDVTRKAWGFLTERQQVDANIQADRAIRIWENIYKKKRMSEDAKNFTGY